MVSPSRSDKPFDLKEGEEIIAEGYRIKILKMNRTLPELVELKALELEKK